MKFVPQNEWVLVEVQEKTNVGSIILIADIGDHLVGKILALPPKPKGLDVKVGDVVIFDRRSAVTITYGGQKAFMARAADIVTRVEQ